MSKMNELSALLDSLIECGQKLVDVGTGLKDFYSNTEEVKPKAPATPELKAEAPAPIKFEDVRKILAGKSSAADGKYKAEVKALVSKYSATGNLKGVPESSYAALIAEAEVLGNG